MGTAGRSRAAWVFARNTILIGFLTVLLMEFALRALGFSRALLYEPDSLVGWSGRPGAQGVYLDEGSAEVRISSAGVRDREHSIVKPADVWRVAALGDSYTEALQVAEDKRFTSVIERLLGGCDAGGGRRVEVLNFGVSGFGTAQEYLFLRDRVLRYAPDVVVLAFLPGNDFTDNVRALDPSLASRPYVTLDGSGQIVWDRSFEASRSFRIKSSTIYRALLSASDFSRVVQAAFFVRDMWRHKRIPAADREAKGHSPKTDEPGLSAGVYTAPRTREWQQAWNIAERLIEEMSSLAAQSATRFLLVTLSSGIQVDPDVKRFSEVAERHGLEDLFYADDRLQAYATHSGIEVLGLARPLAEYARHNNVFLHGFPADTQSLSMSINMNVLGSGHWNERGHQAAGEVIARYLCRRGAPGRSHARQVR